MGVNLGRFVRNIKTDRQVQGQVQAQVQVVCVCVLKRNSARAPVPTTARTQPQMGVYAIRLQLSGDPPAADAGCGSAFPSATRVAALHTVKTRSRVCQLVCRCSAPEEKSSHQPRTFNLTCNAHPTDRGIVGGSPAHIIALIIDINHRTAGRELNQIKSI